MNNQVKIIVKVKHDKGTIKINTFAASLEEAKQKVITVENCPPSAIIYAKVAAVTIYDIKRKTNETAPYFFTRKTLSFFRQKVSDFKVSRYGNDKFLIQAGSFGGNTTKRLFNPFTNELEYNNQVN